MPAILHLRHGSAPGFFCQTVLVREVSVNTVVTIDHFFFFVAYNMAPPNVCTYSKVADSDRSTNMSLSTHGSVSVAEYNELKSKLEEEKNEKLRLLASLSATHGAVAVDENVKAQIRRYVKYTIFHDIKFIKTSEEFDDLSKPHTFGQKVIASLSNSYNKHMNPRDLWNAYKKHAKTALNTRRSDVQCSIHEQVVRMWQKTEWLKGDLDEVTSARKPWLTNNATMVKKGECKILHWLFAWCFKISAS